MNEALTWAKAHIAIVIFVLLMILAPAGIIYYAGTQKAKVAEDAQKFQSDFSKLKSLSQTSFTDPVTGEQMQVTLNKPLLDNYEQVVQMQRSDNDAVINAAIDHNRKNYTPLVPAGWSDARGPWLFPEPPARERELRPAQFHELLYNSYDAMLSEFNAGPPPAGSDLEQELIEAKAQFISQKFAKDPDDTLTDEEQRLLREQLGDTRIQLCAEAAQNLDFYVSSNDLGLPGFDISNQPGIEEMWEWQWRYWIHRDLLSAVATANEDADSVVRAPVQRVLYIQVFDQQIETGDSNSGNSRSRRGGNSGGSSSSGVGGPINPSKPIAPKFGEALTGLSTNSFYDVRNVGMGLVVDTDRLPEVLNALAQQNFISIVDMNVQPRDPFADAAAGYFYAPDGLVTLDLSLQTVWFRQWTSEYMPDAVKTALGIPTNKPNAGSGDS